MFSWLKKSSETGLKNIRRKEISRVFIPPLYTFLSHFILYFPSCFWTNPPVDQCKWFRYTQTRKHLAPVAFQNFRLTFSAATALDLIVAIVVVGCVCTLCAVISVISGP